MDSEFPYDLPLVIQHHCQVKVDNSGHTTHSIIASDCPADKDLYIKVRALTLKMCRISCSAQGQSDIYVLQQQTLQNAGVVRVFVWTECETSEQFLFDLKRSSFTLQESQRGYDEDTDLICYFTKFVVQADLKKHLV